MNDLLNKVGSMFSDWANRNGENLISLPIAPERTDPHLPDDEIEANRHYMRIWLCSMFLAKEKSWWTKWYPAVNTNVKLKFANQLATISHVTGSSAEKSRGVKLDYAVTDLIPFAGGTVEIDSGLVGLQGENSIVAGIDILQDFSKLVVAPIAQMLDVAKNVSAGMQKLMAAHDGEVRLAFSRTYAKTQGGNRLKAGYIAVVGATQRQIDPEKLSVKDSRLFIGDPAVPLEGYDYLLLRIERLDERDDWRFPDIEKAMNAAKNAAFLGKIEEAEANRIAACSAALNLPDFAPHDMRRVVKAIQDEIDATSPMQQVTPDPDDTLTDVMKRRAVTVEEALLLPEVTMKDLL